MNNFSKPWLLLLTFLMHPCIAQTYKFIPVGESISIPINITSKSACNLEITIDGKSEQHIINPENPIHTINFTGTDIRTNHISWGGKFRFRGLNSISGCQVSGKLALVFMS
jgi:hypothetical protein